MNLRSLRSSEFPVRMVHPRWVRSLLWNWDGTRRRRPYNIYWTTRDNLLVARWLYLLVRARRPERVVETGVHLGKSSCAILAGLEANGHGRLISIDLPHFSPVVNGDGVRDAAHVDSEDEMGTLVPRWLRGRWTLLRGDSKSLLINVIDRGVDLFHHDSDHSRAHQLWEYESVFDRARRGTIIASDDTGWTTAWADFNEAHRDRLTPLRDGPAGHRASLVTGRGRFGDT